MGTFCDLYFLDHNELSRVHWLSLVKFAKASKTF